MSLPLTVISAEVSSILVTASAPFHFIISYVLIKNVKPGLALHNEFFRMFKAIEVFASFIII
jgi:hypothetical protein